MWHGAHVRSGLQIVREDPVDESTPSSTAHFLLQQKSGNLENPCIRCLSWSDVFHFQTLMFQHQQYVGLQARLCWIRRGHYVWEGAKTGRVKTSFLVFSVRFSARGSKKWVALEHQSQHTVKICQVRASNRIRQCFHAS